VLSRAVIRLLPSQRQFFLIKKELLNLWLWNVLFCLLFAYCLDKFCQSLIKAWRFIAFPHPSFKGPILGHFDWVVCVPVRLPCASSNWHNCSLFLSLSLSLA
jgi:hypothetical protein